MVSFDFTADSLVLHVHGLDKLWAAKSSLSIPLMHITGVELGVADDAREALKHSLRVGTHLPHIITAGRFYKDGKIAFWDVHSGDQAITIRVVHDDYTHLVVEVADPLAAVDEIRYRITG